jgi:hypothetical protein
MQAALRCATGEEPIQFLDRFATSRTPVLLMDHLRFLVDGGELVKTMRAVSPAFQGNKRTAMNLLRILL